MTKNFIKNAFRINLTVQNFQNFLGVMGQTPT